ncbi:MAG: 2OG-Fe(II) oxygenase [Actinomycetota bacterium]|nr:2OG-Fe(II) oxygenase [Actinomycetota bacterium]
MPGRACSAVTRRPTRSSTRSAPRGAFVVFPTHHRPQQGARRYYKVGLRHGVSTVTRGSRTALGIIFHDAR